MDSALNILVVEDHDDLREVTVAALSAMGHHVHGVDCAEAVDDACPQPFETGAVLVAVGGQHAVDVVVGERQPVCHRVAGRDPQQRRGAREVALGLVDGLLDEGPLDALLELGQVEAPAREAHLADGADDGRALARRIVDEAAHDLGVRAQPPLPAQLLEAVGAGLVPEVDGTAERLLSLLSQRRAPCGPKSSRLAALPKHWSSCIRLQSPG